MKINFARKLTKDTFWTLAPINGLLRTTALSNIYRKGTDLEVSRSIVRSVFHILIFGLLNTFCLYHKIKTFKGRAQNGLVRFSDSIQLTYLFSYFNYIVDLLFVYKYGRESLLRYFKAFDHIDEVLGSPCYNEIRRTIVQNMIIAITVFLCISLFDYTCWNLVEEFWPPMLYAIDYLYFFLNMMSVLDLISHVIQVQYRLIMIKNLLEVCYSLNIRFQ
ncbi:uncharacterized protein LOC142980171 [Anticarsia gemmatalis]|uniref:uncharacterized protein LOC142980171 n=1 Tax=Anticarsia gemmatalis TaxID=129554 RepID=UPI003F770B2D